MSYVKGFWIHPSLTSGTKQEKLISARIHVALDFVFVSSHDVGCKICPRFLPSHQSIHEGGS